MTVQNAHPDNCATTVAVATKVFLDHKDFIREVIQFHVQNEHQADDLFQDLFLSFVSNPLPADMQKIESYLYRAITNDIIDAAHREEKYCKCIRVYGECLDHPRSQQTPPEAILEKEEASRVLDIIEQRLPHTEAQAVCLQYQDSLSAREIAKKMGVGVATARGYVCEGLGRIRRLLGVEEAR